MTSGLYAGIGLLVLFALLIIVFWVPWLARGRRDGRLTAGSTLVANLGRVVQLELPSTIATAPSPEPSPSPSQDPSQEKVKSAVAAAYVREKRASLDRPARSLTLIETEHRTGPSQTVTTGETGVHGDELKRRVAEMYEIVSSGSVSAQATAQWLHLLKEINDLHNAGEIPTETFRQMNTELLSVLERPLDE